jgi:HAD superfamily hydrolase (TIGR01509 family)
MAPCASRRRAGGAEERVIAALFDLNGTVVDDMRLHGELWRDVSLELGHEVPPERFYRDWAGWKSEEVIARIVGHAVPAETVRALVEAKEARYREIYRTRVKEVPGCVAFLRRLRAAGVKLALATAAPEANRALALDGLGIAADFDRVVGPEGVRRGKPAPDIFLAAAAALGVAPARCVVFEDALNGVVAARAAGMRAVGIATAFTLAELREAGAEWAAEDFRTLPEGLLALLGLR